MPLNKVNIVYRIKSITVLYLFGIDFLIKVENNMIPFAVFSDNEIIGCVFNLIIIIESECIGKVYGPDEFDKNEWTVMGEPDTTITVNRPATVELTCATIVNRLPDVINAKPGFIPTCDMDELMYRPKSLDSYLK
jgi:hypothetical protein